MKNDELCQYCDVGPNYDNECKISDADIQTKCEEHILFYLSESTFHMSDEEAHKVVDMFIEANPYMLTMHNRAYWYDYA